MADFKELTNLIKNCEEQLGRGENMVSRKPAADQSNRSSVLGAEENGFSHLDFGSGFAKPMPSASNFQDFEMHELYGVDDQAYLMAEIDKHDPEFG